MSRMAAVGEAGGAVGEAGGAVGEAGGEEEEGDIRYAIYRARRAVA
jgi:hypothetical protein